MRWLLNTRSTEPWTFFTILAGLCLVGATVASGSAGGCALLIVIDVAGDVGILYLISRMAREPDHTDPDYVPMSRGRRAAAITLAALSVVIAATALKTLDSVQETITAVYAWYAHGKPLVSPIPANPYRATLLFLFTVTSIICFGKSYRATRTRQTITLPPAAETTVNANLVTGGVNGGIQIFLLAWMFFLKPILLASANPEAGAAMSALDVLMPPVINILAVTLLCYYVVRRGIEDIKAQWGPLVGQSREMESIYLRRLVSGISGVRSVPTLNVYEIGPQDAIIVAEIDIHKAAMQPEVERQIQERADDCAEDWQRGDGSGTPIHSMHLQVNWLRNGKPASRVAACVDAVGSVTTVKSLTLPILHFDSRSNRLINQTQVPLLQSGTDSVGAPVEIDGSIASFGWAGAFDMQEEVVSQLTRNQAFSTQNISYYGRADIPQTIHLGYLLTNARHIAIHQYDTDEECWYDPADPLEGDPISFSLQHDLDNWPPDYRGPIAVAVEVSSRIQESEVTEALGSGVPIVSLRSSRMRKGLVLSNQELRDLAREFSRLLEKIKIRLPSYDSIHLFCATPCGASFQVGRQISTTMYGRVYVYYYNRNQTPKSQRVLVLPRSSESLPEPALAMRSTEC